MNIGEDTHCVTTIDVTRDIITAIDIVDLTSQHPDTGGIASRDLVGVVSGIQLDGRTCDGHTVSHGTYVGLTATTIDIIDHHAGTFYLQEQTFRTGHAPLVTATIEVTNTPSLQVPSGSDLHLRLVVTSKQASNLVFSTTRIREGGVDIHLVLEAGVGQQLIVIRILDAIHHLTGVIQTNDRLFCDRSVITTTIGINNRTAQKFQVSLTNVRQLRLGIILIDLNRSSILCPYFPLTRLTFSGILNRIVTIATSEELADINLLSIICFFLAIHLGRDAYKGIPGVIDLILACFSTDFRQFCRDSIRCTDGSGDIITAINLIDNDIVRSMLAIDMDKGTATHISHTGTAIDGVHITCQHSHRGTAPCITGITATIDITANHNLGYSLLPRQHKEQQEQCLHTVH